MMVNDPMPFSLAWAERGLSSSVKKARERLRARWEVEGFSRHLTLGEVLTGGGEQYGNTELVFHSAATPLTAITLHDLVGRAQVFAASLDALGLTDRDVLAVQMPNQIETAVTYYAAAFLGLVLLPIVTIYGPSEVEFILRQSGARALVVPDRWRTVDFAERIGRMGDLPLLEHVHRGRRPIHGGDRHLVGTRAERGPGLPCARPVTR